MLEVSLEGFVPANTYHPKGKCNVHISCPSPSKERWGSKCFVQPTPEILVSALKQDAHSRQRRPCSHHASLCPLISHALLFRTATPAPKSHASCLSRNGGTTKGKPHFSSIMYSQVHFQCRLCIKCTFMHITCIFKDLYIHSFTFLARLHPYELHITVCILLTMPRVRQR